jgi:hypothetical protein|tara:strand:- start:62889 stop:63008 length:120 start_codon:yes stop_codon:yes gene_type:complete
MKLNKQNPVIMQAITATLKEVIREAITKTVKPPISVPKP